MNEGRKDSDSKELDEEYQQLMKEREKEELDMDDLTKGLIDEVNAIDKEEGEQKEME